MAQPQVLNLLEERKRKEKKGKNKSDGTCEPTRQFLPPVHNTTMLANYLGGLRLEWVEMTAGLVGPLGGLEQTGLV
jgi:hypothetical protein